MRRGDAATRRHGEAKRRDIFAASPLRRVAASVAVLMLLGPAIAHACPVCWGESDSPQAKGMNNAIWVMLGLIGFVQIGFVALFVGFWRRARAIRKRKEQFHLIRGMRYEP